MILATVPQPGPWKKNARCRNAPTSVFFPTRGDDVGQAKAICARCPVLEECRTYALAHPGLLGVFGGLSEVEREAMRQGHEEVA